MLRAGFTPRTLKAVVMAVALVGFPVAYVAYVNGAPIHQPYVFVEGLRNPGFASGWTFVENVLVGGYLVNENDSLRIVANSTMPLDGIVGADGWAIPRLNTSQYPYLRVSLIAPPVYVGVRIILWAGDQPFLVLKKTYGSADWHTEIINLNFLGMSGDQAISRIELTWFSVERPAGPGTVVMFRDLAFGSIS